MASLPRLQAGGRWAAGQGQYACLVCGTAIPSTRKMSSHSRDHTAKVNQLCVACAFRDAYIITRNLDGAFPLSLAKTWTESPNHWYLTWLY